MLFVTLLVHLFFFDPDIQFHLELHLPATTREVAAVRIWHICFKELCRLELTREVTFKSIYTYYLLILSLGNWYFHSASPLVA